MVLGGCDVQAGLLRDCTAMGAVLVLANSISFMMLAHAWVRSVYSASRTATVRRIRYIDNHELANPRPLAADEVYHLFLSHSWVSGQDTMRIVKQRLLEMMPTLSVFLDVDEDFEIGQLERYIGQSQVVLISCTDGYFTSKNCMREFTQTIEDGKPIIAILDPTNKQAGLSVEDVRELVLEHDSARGAHHFERLLSEPPLEWNRLGIFQDVTLKLIAERLLPEPRIQRAVRAASHVDRTCIYYSGEHERLRQSPHVPVPRDGKAFHVFASRHNQGARSLIAELNSHVLARHNPRHHTRACNNRHLLQAL